MVLRKSAAHSRFTISPEVRHHSMTLALRPQSVISATRCVCFPGRSGHRLVPVDPSSIDVNPTDIATACLSTFPWATFRSTKATVKLHTLLDLRPKSSRIHAARGSFSGLHRRGIQDIWRRAREQRAKAPAHSDSADERHGTKGRGGDRHRRLAAGLSRPRVGGEWA